MFFCIVLLIWLFDSWAPSSQEELFSVRRNVGNKTRLKTKWKIEKHPFFWHISICLKLAGEGSQVGWSWYSLPYQRKEPVFVTSSTKEVFTALQRGSAETIAVFQRGSSEKSPGFRELGTAYQTWESPLTPQCQQHAHIRWRNFMPKESNTERPAEREALCCLCIQIDTMELSLGFVCLVNPKACINFALFT